MSLDTAGGVRPVGLQLRGAAPGAPAVAFVVHDEHGRAGSAPVPAAPRLLAGVEVAAVTDMCESPSTGS